MPLRYLLLTPLLLVLLAGCRDEARVAAPEQEASADPPSAADSAALVPPADPDEALAETPAPDFRLSGPDGEFALADQRGRIVVLNFWATWNELSHEGLDALAQLHSELADDGVVVVALTQDEHPLQAIRTWAETHAPPPFPLLADTAQAVAQQFGGVEMLPTTVVVDREGIVRARHTGILSHDELLDLIGPILIEDDEPLVGLPPPAPGVIQPIAARAVPPLIADGAMLVDVRPPAERDTVGALPHARHRPLVLLLRDDLPANYAVPVIFVGNGGHDASEAAERALAWGYVAVYVVEGGVPAWTAAGLSLKPVAPTRLPPVLPARTVLG